MNYRHIYHAGNFADVVKHLALVAVITHLRKKNTPFAILDSHAGRGLYALTSAEARRTGEADAGIGKLLGDRAGLPALVVQYLELVEGMGKGLYPGSPRIAAQLLRATDRLVAVEKQPDEFAALARALAPFVRASAIEGDGFERLPALVPPSERRGAVLIDPPFEQEGEFERTAEMFSRAYLRFETGIYLIWFPVKTVSRAEAFVAEILNKGVRKALRLDFALSATDKGDNKDNKERLTRAGVLAINPPYRFDAQMHEAFVALESRLGPDAKAALTWLAGEGS